MCFQYQTLVCLIHSDPRSHNKFSQNHMIQWMNVLQKQGGMSCDPRYHSCLSCKTPLDIKDNMTFDMLVPYWYLLAFIQNLEGWLYIFEFLIDGISPQSIYILLVKFVVLVHIFRHPDSEIVGTLPVPGLWP